jgi:hypothetical protein
VLRRERAQRDVVRFRSGEIHERSTVACRRDDPQIDLQAARESHRRARRAARDDVADLGVTEKRRHHGRGACGGDEDIDVADRLPPTPEAAGDNGILDAANGP